MSTPNENAHQSMPLAGVAVAGESATPRVNILWPIEIAKYLLGLLRTMSSLTTKPATLSDLHPLDVEGFAVVITRSLFLLAAFVANTPAFAYGVDKIPVLQFVVDDACRPGMDGSLTEDVTSLSVVKLASAGQPSTFKADIQCAILPNDWEVVSWVLSVDQGLREAVFEGYVEAGVRAYPSNESSSEMNALGAKIALLTVDAVATAERFYSHLAAQKTKQPDIMSLDLFKQKVGAIVPDWEKIEAHQLFQKYMQQKHPLSGQPRGEHLNEAVQSRDVQRAADIYRVTAVALGIRTANE